MATFLVLGSAAVGLFGVALAQDSSNTATVDLSTTNGAAQHMAAGFIYGMPDSGFGQSPDQIPLSFYTNMGFTYGRSGGGQDPAGGWVVSLAAYQARFQSTLDNYNTARSAGGRFQVLPHDLWGTDHANSSSYWPGDNGDWTDYDNFLDQVFSDFQSNNMLDGLDYDLWNEPDGGYFWLRSESQYLAMWNRTYNRIRSDSALNGMLIVGPSSASQPSPSYDWWTTWLQYIVQNNVIPDQYTWHDESGDPQTDAANLAQMLSTYNAPSRQINVNEYATYAQQNSAAGAWYISRLERINAYGLRGNWLSACQLHDFMASLLVKSNDNDCTGGDYTPNGEYHVYQWYSQNMTGTRAATTGSGDGNRDVFAVIQDSSVQILSGSLNTQGTWYITVDNLSSVGLPDSGNLVIQTYGFADCGNFCAPGPPSNLGTYGHDYSGNSVTFPIYQTSQDEVSLQSMFWSNDAANEYGTVFRVGI